MYNPRLKDKHALVDLARYGTEARKSIHPDVLIGEHCVKCPPFREGDILDANATVNLIGDTLNGCEIFQTFDEEGQRIAERLDNLEQTQSENYTELSDKVDSLTETHEQDITRLDDKTDNLALNIINQERVVDISKLSEVGGKTSYLVTKLDGSHDTIIVAKGDKGDQGESFSYEDFTPEQLEALKVKGDKGDKGTSITRVQQTTVAYTDRGVNVVTIDLDDGSSSLIQIRNGATGEDPQVRQDLQTEIARATSAENALQNNINSVNSRVDHIVEDAPEALDTLLEIAEKLHDEDDAVAALTLEISLKYTKPATGIPSSDMSESVRASLSKADTALQEHLDISGKADLADLATVATTGEYSDLLNKPAIPTVPTNVSAFTNDAGYLTEHQDISGKANTADLSSVAFSGDYADLNNTPTIPVVPTNVSSFTNDAGYLTLHQDISGKANIADLATVATSGSYDDLADKPTIPSLAGYATEQWVLNQNYLTEHQDISGKADITNLSNVAFSGDYEDLSNTPTIPSEVTESTVSGWGFTKNAGTITGIKMNGSSKGTSGVVDLGTVITAHQDISGKVDKTTTVNGHALSGNVSVTKSDVGLGNVTNDSQVKRSEMGAASGVATLDSNGKVLSSQLPSYVDDVIEGYFYNSKFYKESEHTTEIAGETGKIYVDLSTNKTYRWGGSAYVVISETLALGETSSTAYRGDRGKTAYTHSQTTSGNPHNVTKSDIGLGNVGNFKAVSTVASQGLSDTEKANARANIGAGTSSFSGSYNDLSGKPTIPAAAANGTYTVKTLVGSTTTNVSDFTANQSSADDVTFVQGSNVTITPDATNRKITISAKDTTYGVVSTSADGLAPKVTDTSKFLKGDGTWATPADTNNRRSFFGTCDTAAATAAKVVEISDTSGWELKAGTIVGIKFTNTNSASEVTLNVNSSGAKSIWYSNAEYTGNSSGICGYASRVTYYMYDGTYWVWLNIGVLDGNTDTKVKQTVTTTASNYEVLFSYTADNTTRTEGARKNSNLKFNPSTGNLQATQLNGVTIGSSPKFTDNDTKNTAGTTDKTDTKMFLVAATEQSANPVTYSNSSCYIGTDNCLYSGGAKVLTSHQSLSNYYTKTQVDALTRHTRLTDFDLNVLKQAVADGNLEKYGLKVGDQKTINGHTYVIAGLNPMKGTHSYRVNTNHVGLIVIPHTSQPWNASGNTSTGADERGAGYLNSDLHYYLKNTVLPMCNTDLGADNLISHKKLLSNLVNTTGYNRRGSASGCSSGWTWEDTKICALSEVQVYGGTVWSSSGFDTGEACRQLDVFQNYSSTEIFGDEYPWLKDVVSDTTASTIANNGYATDSTVSDDDDVAALILFH